MSYEAKSISPPNQWRNFIREAALSVSPYIFQFTDLLAAVAFAALAVAS